MAVIGNNCHKSSMEIYCLLLWKCMLFMAMTKGLLSLDGRNACCSTRKAK
ncbi:MAG: hypothetical protein GX941_08445 [Candidatus Methanofastidiosa archaeon]|nr:hypothetical protein [Candidatus Methanofastidiosa archaeon]HOM95384.1 hypothetical protein [Methanofastidiosum sp.]HPC80835.1 hypothetical protein [Methanofastidiosum sp.]HRS25029.1 hypothetical protein [Methanofastidiosum sp.]